MNINYQDLEGLEKLAGNEFFILKADLFTENIRAFQNSFKEEYQNFRLGYSYKTNYIPYVCKLADESNCYAEIVSEMELKIAQGIKVEGKNIIYNGPEKTISSLEYCMLHKSKINIDNLSELEDVINICEGYPETEFSIGLRINIDFEDDFFSRFGFAIASREIDIALQKISKQRNLKLKGLHTHSTRPDKSVNIFGKKLERLIELSKHYELKDLSYLDIGGGFYGRMNDIIKSQFNDEVTELESYGSYVGQIMKKNFPLEEVELIIEPGVAVTANILDYFAQVSNVKSVYGKKIALCSGSFHNIKPSGHKKNLDIQVHSSSNETHHPGKFEIVGYTCLENDYLYNGYTGSLEPGDYIQFKDVGAYTIVFKPLFIKPPPPIFVEKDGEFKLIRKKEEFKDLFKSFTF